MKFVLVGILSAALCGCVSPAAKITDRTGVWVFIAENGGIEATRNGLWQRYRYTLENGCTAMGLDWWSERIDPLRRPAGSHLHALLGDWDCPEGVSLPSWHVHHFDLQLQVFERKLEQIPCERFACDRARRYLQEGKICTVYARPTAARVAERDTRHKMYEAFEVDDTVAPVEQPAYTEVMDDEQVRWIEEHGDEWLTEVCSLSPRQAAEQLALARARGITAYCEGQSAKPWAAPAPNSTIGADPQNGGLLTH